MTNVVVKNSDKVFTYTFSIYTDFSLPSSEAITEKHYS